MAIIQKNKILNTGDDPKNFKRKQKKENSKKQEKKVIER